MLFIFFIISFMILFCYFGISVWSRSKIYDDINKLPFNNVGVILGTSKYVHGGNINCYFKNRIDAAILLFHNKKIKYFIVSGNRETYYNEPLLMEQELIKAGVPCKLIHKDYIGVRTINSVYRAYKIFGQKKFTIISQKFHNERAIFIADHIAGLDAIAFNAITPLCKSTKQYFREAFARIKALWDILFYVVTSISSHHVILCQNDKNYIWQIFCKY